MHQSQKSSNFYFDVKVQTSPSQFTQVRVMKQREDGSKRQLFIDKMESQQPVKLSNITATPSGTSFFNKGSVIIDTPSVNFKCNPPSTLEITKISSLAQSTSGLFTISGTVTWTGEQHTPNENSKKLVRDGIITDSSGSIPLSVWQEHIEQVQEGQFYTITNCNLRHYYGKRLATTKSSVVTGAENQDISDVPIKEQRVDTFICCPDILNLSVNKYPICNNKSCRKKLNPTAGTKFVRCLYCNRNMLLQNSWVDMNISFQLQKGDKTYSVTAFSKVVSKCLGEDIHCYKDDTDPLTEKLLLLKDIDFYLSPDQNLVSKMEQH